MSERIILLNLIKEHKDALFVKKGNSRVPLEKKIAAWTEIEKKARELRLLEANKDWRHIRNVTWQNWRKRAIDKAILAKKFYGTPKANKVIFDQSEKIIFEILGDESPLTVDNYPVASSSSCEDESQVAFSTYVVETKKENEQLNGDTAEEQPTKTSNSLKRKRLDSKGYDALKRDLLRKENESLEKQWEMLKSQIDKIKPSQTEEERNKYSSKDPIKFEKTSDVAVQCSPGSIKPMPSESANPSRVKSKGSDGELNFLRKTQMVLEQKLISKQLGMLEREQYKIDLEIYKMERDLNLPPSKFTRRFYKKIDVRIEEENSINFDFFNEASNHIGPDIEVQYKLEPDEEWVETASDLE